MLVTRRGPRLHLIRQIGTKTVVSASLGVRPIERKHFTRVLNLVRDSLSLGLVRVPEFQIRRSVIGLLPIFVMDALCLQQRPTQDLFHDHAMLKMAAGSLGADMPVAVRIDVANRFW